MTNISIISEKTNSNYNNSDNNVENNNKHDIEETKEIEIKNNYSKCDDSENLIKNTISKESNVNSSITEISFENNVLNTGNIVLDKLIGGFETDIITTIFGPAGSGKTNFCIMGAISAINSGKKVIYVDTDASFSVERLKQISPNYRTILDNMIFFRPMSFREQKITFDNIEKIISEKVGLIIVDSIAMLYRLELGNENDVFDVNRELGKQITILTKIARTNKIPVLITNQVYASMNDKEMVKMVGGNFLKYGSKCLIEIQEIDSTKKVILRKHRSLPRDIEVSFKIISSGVEEVNSELNTNII